MKQVIAFATIGACLLVLSGGAALADNAHAVSGGTGQNGTGSVPSPLVPIAGCGSTGGGLTLTQGSPPGQVGNTNTSSPFPTVGTPPVADPTGAASKYAGMGGGNYGAGTTMVTNTHANSQYDNACFQHQMP